MLKDYIHIKLKFNILQNIIYATFFKDFIKCHIFLNLKVVVTIIDKSKLSNLSIKKYTGKVLK